MSPESLEAYTRPFPSFCGHKASASAPALPKCGAGLLPGFALPLDAVPAGHGGDASAARESSCESSLSCDSATTSCQTSDGEDDAAGGAPAEARKHSEWELLLATIEIAFKAQSVLEKGAAVSDAGPSHKRRASPCAAGVAHKRTKSVPDSEFGFSGVAQHPGFAAKAQPTGFGTAAPSSGTFDADSAEAAVATARAEAFSNMSVQAEGRRGPRGQSRFKGVCITRAGKWRAVIYIGRKQKYLGVFDSELQAAYAYNESAAFHFGAGAKLNRLPAAQAQG